MRSLNSEASSAYRLGALALMVAIGTIIAALLFQYVGGYEPCPLCLTERYAYYAGIPVLFLSLVALSSGHRSLAVAGFGLVALAFFANAALSGYHAGVEWKFWAGPSTCTGDLRPLGSPADLLKGMQVNVIRCDEPNWWFLGLSFAGWDAVVSFFLGISSILATRMAVEGRLHAQRGISI